MLTVQTDGLTLPGVDVPLARHLQPGEVGVLLTDGAAEGLLSRQNVTHDLVIRDSSSLLQFKKLF